MVFLGFFFFFKEYFLLAYECTCLLDFGDWPKKTKKQNKTFYVGNILYSYRTTNQELQFMVTPNITTEKNAFSGTFRCGVMVGVIWSAVPGLSYTTVSGDYIEQ